MTILRTSAFALPLLLTLPAVAQSTIVSPAGYDVTEGNSGNAFPFNSTVIRRYQQIHSDIGGQARVITKLSFRGDANNNTNYVGTRAIDMEMLMGNSVDWNQAQFTFAQNFTSTPMPVFARRVLNMGPQGQNQQGVPNPFNLDVPLDTPFVYTGTTSLIWELVMHGQVGTGTFNAVDAVTHASSTGATVITGTGCTATGRTAAMTHTAAATDRGGMLLFQTSISNGPSSAPALLTIGGTNPSLTVPGLCGSLYTDLAATVPMGTTTTTGALSGDASLNLLFANNVFTGVTLYTQAIAVDAGRTDPLQISVSNGRSLTFPAVAAGPLVRASRLYNNSGGTTATAATFSTSTHGYVLTTQFTY